MDNTFN